MEWLADNWYLLILAGVIVYIAIFFTVKFLKEPNETKIKNFKEWLKYAVIQAETVLGSGTGQLKLRMVYNMAVEKFPFIVNFVTFEEFSIWVDEALDWMERQLKTNVNISNLVNGGEKDESADNLQETESSNRE